MEAAAPAPLAAGYELLDFGRGRKLERFGPFVLDRPAPAADAVAPAEPAAWTAATARYVRGPGGGGGWQPADALPPSWEVAINGLTLQLRPAPSGGVGLFPEQLALVSWLEGAVGRLTARLGQDGPPSVLNLFAHTGLLTLAAARAGARVAHVDASRPAVAGARRNADRSGLADRPIRWLVDDALAFARRELRRGRTYDGVVLDPPTYGHGPDGDPWRLETGIADLLGVIAGLTAGRPAFMVLTAHAAGLRPIDLLGQLRAALGEVASGRAGVGPLEIRARDGRRLAAGLALCWEAP